MLRFVGGGALLLAVGLIWRRSELLCLRWRDAMQCAGLAMVGIVGMCVFLFYGQQTTGVINSSVLMQVNPVFIVLLGMFAGERLKAANFVGVLISLFGTMLVMGMLDSQGLHVTLGRNRGDLLVLASAFCWAVYGVFSKGLVMRLGGYSATTWVMVAGALELVILQMVLPVEFQWPQAPRHWAAIAYLAAVPTAIGFFAWYEAMRLIRLSLLNVMQYLTPAFAIMLAWFLLGERLSGLQWVGVGIVMTGVVLVSRQPDGR